MVEETAENIHGFKSIKRKLHAFGLKIDVRGLGVDNVSEFVRLAETGDGLVFVDSAFTGPISFETLSQRGLLKLAMPSAGVMDVDMAGERFRCEAGSAYLFDLGKPTVWAMHASFRSLCVFMDASLLVARLAERLGRPVRQVPVFAPVLDMSRPEIAAFVGFVKSLQSTGVLSTLHSAPVSARRLSTLLADMILEVLEHDKAGLIRDQPRDLPRRVRRAMAYIEAHAGRVIPNAELADALGIGIRSLQYEFQEHVGSSIGDYARSVRLANARRDIANEPATKISEIARRWGFTNTTRFQQRFLSAYGESVAAFTSGTGEGGDQSVRRAKGTAPKSAMPSRTDPMSGAKG